jgi:glucose/arabinose dehydrogenase
MKNTKKHAFFLLTLPCVLLGVAAIAACGSRETNSIVDIAIDVTLGRLLTGKEAMGDWKTDAPGVRRKIVVADLPKPFDTPSVDRGPRWAPRPEGALPKAPAGFKVEQMVSGLDNPRVITTAPNGDVFIALSNPGKIQILRDADNDGKPEVNATFATGLVKPFGIAFYPAQNPQFIYVANTDSVVRFAYKSGDTQANGTPETIVSNIPGGGQLRGGGHWTRDIAFSKDGSRMFVSVGSFTNINTEGRDENRRASILSFTPDGKDEKLYASGIRNPVGLAVHPTTGTLWTSVNERDGLGDMLVPDYVTKVKEGGFYGWPWYYLGGNPEPRHNGAHPELKDKVITPDVLLQSHSASLDLVFYTGKSFPSEYSNHLFACEHGSWNRARRTGYKVVRIPVDKKGNALGEYEDFLTGFVVDEASVWGRPVGATVASDGSLLVTDDFTGSVWRVVYTGKKR